MDGDSLTVPKKAKPAKVATKAKPTKKPQKKPAKAAKKKPAPKAISPAADPRTLGHKGFAAQLDGIPEATNAPAKPRTGRPSKFTPAIFDEILGRITDGEALSAICRSEGMPATYTVFRWIAGDEALRDKYARACEARSDAHAEEIIEISDEQAIEPVEVARNKLRVDTRKWLMSKMKPKKYGDKVEHSGTINFESALNAVPD